MTPAIEAASAAKSQPPVTVDNTKQNVLAGVKCYIEVRWPGGSDGSHYFESLLCELGAEVSMFFTEDVTHVLWGNGNLQTLERVRDSEGDVKAVNLSWPME